MDDKATPKATLATAEQLFAPYKRRYKELTLPVSGHDVRIQSLTERELSAFQTGAMSKTGNANLSRIESANRRLIVLCLVDGAGNRILNAKTALGKLEDWDSMDTNYLSTECSSFVGLKADEIEGLVKNSGKTTDES